MKVRYFKRLSSLVVVSLSLNTSLLIAEQQEPQLNEDFLEFLASMTDIDGTTSDPLDMLDAESFDYSASVLSSPELYNSETYNSESQNANKKEMKHNLKQPKNKLRKNPKLEEKENEQDPKVDKEMKDVMQEKK